MTDAALFPVTFQRGRAFTPQRALRPPPSAPPAPALAVPTATPSTAGGRRARKPKRCTQSTAAARAPATAVVSPASVATDETDATTSATASTRSIASASDGTANNPPPELAGNDDDDSGDAFGFASRSDKRGISGTGAGTGKPRATRVPAVPRKRTRIKPKATSRNSFANTTKGADKLDPTRDRTTPPPTSPSKSNPNTTRAAPSTASEPTLGQSPTSIAAPHSDATPHALAPLPSAPNPVFGRKPPQSLFHAQRSTPVKPVPLPKPPQSPDLPQLNPPATPELKPLSPSPAKKNVVTPVPPKRIDSQNRIFQSASIRAEPPPTKAIRHRRKRRTTTSAQTAAASSSSTTVPLPAEAQNELTAIGLAVSNLDTKHKTPTAVEDFEKDRKQRTAASTSVAANSKSKSVTKEKTTKESAPAVAVAAKPTELKARRLRKLAPSPEAVEDKPIPDAVDSNNQHPNPPAEAMKDDESDDTVDMTIRDAAEVDSESEAEGPPEGTANDSTESSEADETAVQSEERSASASDDKTFKTKRKSAKRRRTGKSKLPNADGSTSTPEKKKISRRAATRRRREQAERSGDEAQVIDRRRVTKRGRTLRSKIPVPLHLLSRSNGVSGEEDDIEYSPLGRRARPRHNHKRARRERTGGPPQGNNESDIQFSPPAQRPVMEYSASRNHERLLRPPAVTAAGASVPHVMSGADVNAGPGTGTVGPESAARREPLSKTLAAENLSDRLDPSSREGIAASKRAALFPAVDPDSRAHLHDELQHDTPLTQADIGTGRVDSGVRSATDATVHAGVQLVGPIVLVPASALPQQIAGGAAVQMAIADPNGPEPISDDDNASSRFARKTTHGDAKSQPAHAQPPPRPPVRIAAPPRGVRPCSLISLPPPPRSARAATNALASVSGGILVVPNPVFSHTLVLDAHTGGVQFVPVTAAQSTTPLALPQVAAVPHAPATANAPHGRAYRQLAREFDELVPAPAPVVGTAGGSRKARAMRTPAPVSTAPVTPPHQHSDPTATPAAGQQQQQQQNNVAGSKRKAADIAGQTGSTPAVTPMGGKKLAMELAEVPPPPTKRPKHMYAKIALVPPHALPTLRHGLGTAADAAARP